VSELKLALGAALTAPGDRPRVVICHTVKGKGIPAAENNPDWHHKSALSNEVVQAIRTALRDSGAQA
jgi:transketolase